MAYLARSSHTATEGQDTFELGFEFFDLRDLVAVVLDERVTIASADLDAGTCTLDVALTDGDELLLVRQTRLNTVPVTPTSGGSLTQAHAQRLADHFRHLIEELYDHFGGEDRLALDGHVVTYRAGIPSPLPPGEDGQLFVSIDGLVEWRDPDGLVEAEGEANTASNVGTGVGFFKQKVGVDLEFYSIAGTSPIVITLNGDTIEVDLDQDAIRIVTTTTAGFMSAADKIKLDGIEAGAQVNDTTAILESDFATRSILARQAGTTVAPVTSSTTGILVKQPDGTIELTDMSAFSNGVLGRSGDGDVALIEVPTNSIVGRGSGNLGSVTCADNSFLGRYGSDDLGSVDGTEAAELLAIRGYYEWTIDTPTTGMATAWTTFQRDCNVYRIIGVRVAGTSVGINIEHTSDLTAAVTECLSSDLVVSSTNGTSTTTITTPAIPGENWIRLQVGTVTGGVTTLVVMLEVVWTDDPL